jgi:hypothetical protein
MKLFQNIKEEQQKTNGSKEEKDNFVSMWLDGYDDLFSDFDPRPFTTRTFSDDFIRQLKKVSKENTSYNLRFILLIPEIVRVIDSEKLIIKRLPQYFQKNFKNLNHVRKKVLQKGLMFGLSGVVLMLIASYISFLELDDYWVHLILVLFEPAGWFLLWTGLDHLVYETKSYTSDINFYKKLRKAKIQFEAY